MSVVPAAVVVVLLSALWFVAGFAYGVARSYRPPSGDAPEVQAECPECGSILLLDVPDAVARAWAENDP